MVINYSTQQLQHVKFTLYSCFNVLYVEIIIYINGSINYPLDIWPIYNCYTIKYDSQHTHTHKFKATSHVRIFVEIHHRTHNCLHVGSKGQWLTQNH
jgi:hypothetical protein